MNFFFRERKNKNNNKIKLIIITAESRAGGLRQKYNNEKNTFLLNQKK